MSTVKEIEEVLRGARRKQHELRFICEGFRFNLDIVESFGTSEENLIAVLKLERDLLSKAVLNGYIYAPANKIADHVNVLRKALSSEMNIKYIDFVARVAVKLGIPSHRMPRVLDGSDAQDQGKFAVSGFVTLVRTHREGWKWEDIGLLGPPYKFELAIAKFDFLVGLKFYGRANEDTLISTLIRNPANSLKYLSLIENELTVEGFGKLGRDLASQECKVEFLCLKGTYVSKEAWEKAFENGICNKLVELEMRSTGLEDSVEEFFKGLTSPNCSLQRLAISEGRWVRGRWVEGRFIEGIEDRGVEGRLIEGIKDRCVIMDWICKALEFPKEGIRLSGLDVVTTARDTKRLSEALSNPHCGLEELTIDTIDQGLGWLGRALQNPNCNLKRLVVVRWDCEESDTDNCEESDTDDSSFWSAVRSPHCKLSHLGLQQRSVRDVVKISEVIAESKLESLDLRGCKIEIGECLSEALTKCKHLKALTIDDLSWTRILESGIEDLTISSSNIERLEDLCQFLENPKCKLRKFKCQSNGDAADRQLLAAMEENYQSRLQELCIYKCTTAIQHRCSQLLERNKIFQNSAFKKFCRPSSAKLFLCGNSRVGKTTIKTNLCRKVSWFPSCLQRHASTVGIELQPLLFKSTKQKLVICDLAGQQHFHAFHHYFLRGSEKDLFLIVCKIMHGNAVEDFEQNLIYWLRFIASHQSASPKRRPKVLIALNFFTAQPDVGYDPMQRVSTIITEKGYRNVLDLGNNETDCCFDVVATNVTSLERIKTKLQEGLGDLLLWQPDIPRECLNARTSLIKHASRQQTQKLIPVKSVGKILLPGHSSQRGEVIKSDIKFVLQFLHDCGDAIYFGLGHEEDDILSRFVILDVQWFMRDVVQLFMDSNDTLQSRMRTDDVHKKLQVHCAGNPEFVKYTLRILHEMGVILPRYDQWDGSWHHLPRDLIVPALLKNKYRSPALTIRNHHWWGRRFGCKEKELKLLPAGIFAIIQVELHKLHKQGFSLGDGWVAFKDNLVNVVARVGGDTDRWEDRQWIDVLIFLPQVVEDRARPDLEEEAEEWMAKVRERMCNSCYSLELEESVLRHGYVLKRISGDDAKPGTWDAVVCGIELVRNEATARGLDYSHTWNDTGETDSWDVTDDVRVSDGNTLKKLLMPSEQKLLVKQKIHELCILVEEVANAYGLSNVEIIPEVARLDSFHDPDSFQANDNKKLVKLIKFEAVRIHQHLDQMDESLEDLKRNLQSMIVKVINIHTNCSKIMMKLNVDSPKYPYLIVRDNILKNYNKLVGESFKVRYMCEWYTPRGRCGQGIGAHEMKESKGVNLEFSPEWLRKFAPVFKPALILLFIATKIGGHVAGVGELVNTIVDESKKSIMDFLDSCLPHGKSVKNPEKNDVEEIFKLVRSKVGKEEDQATIMAKYFSLYPSTIDGRTTWVCKNI